MDNQQRAWKLSVAGCSKHQIAEQLGVSGRTIQRYIDRQLTANSSFPSDLEPAEVNKVRQVQSEILLSAMGKVIRQMHRVEADENASQTDKLFALSAATRALGAANARLARMNALDAPVKIVEESMRLLQVNVTRSEKGPILTWDRSILAKPVGPVPGLTIYEGCKNGDTEKQLTNTAPD